MVVSGMFVILYASSLVLGLDRAVLEEELYGPVALLYINKH